MSAPASRLAPFALGAGAATYASGTSPALNDALKAVLPKSIHALFAPAAAAAAAPAGGAGASAEVAALAASMQLMAATMERGLRLDQRSPRLVLLLSAPLLAGGATWLYRSGWARYGWVTLSQLRGRLKEVASTMSGAIASLKAELTQRFTRVEEALEQASHSHHAFAHTCHTSHAFAHTCHTSHAFRTGATLPMCLHANATLPICLRTWHAPRSSPMYLSPMCVFSKLTDVSVFQIDGSRTERRRRRSECRSTSSGRPLMASARRSVRWSIVWRGWRRIRSDQHKAEERERHREREREIVKHIYRHIDIHIYIHTYIYIYKWHVCPCIATNILFIYIFSVK